MPLRITGLTSASSFNDNKNTMMVMSDEWWLCGRRLYDDCTVSQKPPWIFLTLSPNGWEFLVQILHAYYIFLYTLEYKFLFNYMQVGRSYAILRATIQFTPYAQNVCHRPKRTLAFSHIFPPQVGIFSPYFTRHAYFLIYARLQIFIQLSSIVTNLCHKFDHPACVSADGGHFEHMMAVALNMA